MDIHDVMAIKPNFLTLMGYHIFLTMVLHYYYYLTWLGARGCQTSDFANSFFSDATAFFCK